MQVIYCSENGVEVPAAEHWTDRGKWKKVLFPLREGEKIQEVVVFARQFITGLRFMTNKRQEFFGSKASASEKFRLTAPSGSSIMAFYGTIGQLLESLGCYVLRHDDPVNQNRPKGRSKFQKAR